MSARKSRVPTAAMLRRIASYVDREVRRTVKHATADRIMATDVYRAVARKLRERSREVMEWRAARDTAVRERDAAKRMVTKAATDLGAMTHKLGVVEAERDRMARVVEKAERWHVTDTPMRADEDDCEALHQAVQVYQAQVRQITGGTA